MTKCFRLFSSPKLAQNPFFEKGWVEMKKASILEAFSNSIGAENEARTRDPNLGKVMLYQLSYFRKVVKEMRLELTRHNCHYPLKVARLPIPPFLQSRVYLTIFVVPRTRLELARLSTLAPETSASTIPPPGQALK